MLFPRFAEHTKENSQHALDPLDRKVRQECAFLQCGNSAAYFFWEMIIALELKKRNPNILTSAQGVKRATDVVSAFC